MSAKNTAKQSRKAQHSDASRCVVLTTGDPTLSRTALYFEQYQKGLTITAIAKMFDTSRQTVTEYLKKHDKYKPRGRGNRVKKENRNIPTVKNKVKENSKLVTFYCPPDLLHELDSIPFLNRTEKLIEGAKLFIKKNNK